MIATELLPHRVILGNPNRTKITIADDDGKLILYMSWYF